MARRYRMTPARRAALRKAQAASARKRRNRNKRIAKTVGVVGATAALGAAVYGGSVYRSRAIASNVAQFKANAAQIRKQRGLHLYSHRGGKSTPITGIKARRSKIGPPMMPGQKFVRGWTATNKQPKDVLPNVGGNAPSRVVKKFVSTMPTGTKVRHPLAMQIMREGGRLAK